MDGTLHTCSICRIGTLRRKPGTYAAWHGDQFVVLPSTLVWMCDVCGERTYTQEALDQLSLLIGQNTPPDTNSASRARRGSDASADETTRTRRRA